MCRSAGPEPGGQPWRPGGVLPDMGEDVERRLGVPGYPLAMAGRHGQARRDRGVNRGGGRGQAAGERCDRCCVTEPDGGFGAQASQRPGGITGSAGAWLAGQPLFQVVGDARRAAVPSPADRPVSVAEQAMGPSPFRPAGRGRQPRGRRVPRRCPCCAGRGRPQFAQQRVDLGDGGVGKPVQDGGADELMEPQAVTGGVDERVCGQ